MPPHISLARHRAILTSTPGFGVGRRLAFRLGCLVGSLLMTGQVARAQTWQDADIGAVAAPGSSSGSGYSFVVAGSGADIWDAADAFHFLYQTWTGDGDFVARVSSMDDTDSWAKAGIMFRTSTAADAANLLLAVAPQGVIQLQHRDSAGTATTSDAGIWTSWNWLRITRRGNVFTAYYSYAGYSWEQLGAPVTLNLPGTVLVGLAVTSHHDGMLCHASFDAVEPPGTPPPSAPAAPTGVMATASPTGTLHLTWTNQATNASWIEIERIIQRDYEAPPEPTSTAFQYLASVGADVTSYDDKSGKNGYSYYYRLRAVATTAVPSDPPVYSSYSDIAPAVFPGTWISSDAGSVAAAGSGTNDFYTFTVSGSGADIGGTADAFHFYWQVGGSDVVARVKAMTNPDPGAKAGLMFRGDGTSDDPNVFLYVTPEGSVGFQHRDVAGAATIAGGAATGGPLPLWLKLSRRNNTYTGYYSTDGANWITVGTATVFVARFPGFGFAVTSHHDGTLCEATFDHLAVTGASSYVAPVWPTPPTIQSITATAVSSSEIDVAWTAPIVGAIGYDLEWSTDNVNFTDAGLNQNLYWQQAAFTGLDSSKTYYFRARSYNPDGYSAPSNVVSATPASAVNNPAKPSNLTVGNIAGNQVPLTWTDNSTNETGFEIYRALYDTPFTRVATLPANSTTYTDTNGEYYSSYLYMVRAVNDSGPSGYSDSAFAFTGAPPTTPDTSPAAPSALSATATSSSAVQLAWTDNATNETGFQVERSSDGTTFNALASVAANTTQFTDTTVVAATTYYYRVKAVNGSASSAYTAVASATTPSDASGGTTWQSTDVGSVAAHGSTTMYGSTMTVNGSGADIWDRADAFQFAYLPLNGDGAIVAQVKSMTDTNGWAKAGVMIRESLDAGARNVFVAVTPESAGIVAQARTNPGDTTAQAAGPAVNGPCWLRLSRSGSSFTAATSSDGTTWTTFATFNVPMGSSAYIGLAVTSHADGTLCAAQFDGIKLDGTYPIPRLTGVSSTYGEGTVSSDGSSATVTLAYAGTPTFRGTAAANARINLFIGTPSADTLPDGSGTADANGNWQIGYQGTPLAPGNTYSFYLAASDGVGASSTTFTLTTVAPPPSGSFHSFDVGTVAAAGHTSDDGTTIVVSGSGTDIWDQRDAFQFYADSLSGDGQIIARVTAVDNTDPWAKAGVMMRVGNDAQGANAFLFVTPAFSVDYQARTTFGATTNSQSYSSGSAPMWLRIVRTGNTCAASFSADGANWTAAGSVTLDNPNGWPLIVGLAVTSHHDGVLCNATFDHLSVTASTSSTPPSGGGSWQDADVGSVATAGSTTNYGGTITVAGSGADIWDTSDAFHFYSQALSGDQTIIARVTQLDNTDGWAKAGVMIRSDTTADAPNVFLLVTPAFNVALQDRTQAGGTTAMPGFSGAQAPVWLRLVRTGDTFTAAYSTDGTNWIGAGSVSIAMGSAIRVGLAVTSHHDGTLAHATFDHVTVGPTTSGTSP